MKKYVTILGLLFVSISSVSFAKENSKLRADGKRAPSSVTNQSGTIYLLNRQAVSGCGNRYCKLEIQDSISRSPLFGMSEAVDETIGQLDAKKLYSCSAKGGQVANFYKVYALSNCAEMNPQEFGNAISEKFGGGSGF